MEFHKNILMGIFPFVFPFVILQTGCKQVIKSKTDGNISGSESRFIPQYQNFSLLPLKANSYITPFKTFFSGIRTKFKSKSLNVSYKKKRILGRRIYEISTSFNDYRFSMGKWLSFSGSISGFLTVKSTSLKYTNIFDFLKKIISIEGEIVIKNMVIPFYGRTRKIALTFSSLASRQNTFDSITTFTGKIANTLRLSGKLVKGVLSSKVVFNGLNITSKMPLFISSLFDIRANGEISFSFDKSIQAQLRLSGILALLKFRGKSGEYLSIRNMEDIVLKYKNKKIEIIKGNFSIANGKIKLKGFIKKDIVNISFDSKSNIALFSPWIPGSISRFSGVLTTKGRISGASLYPDFQFKTQLKNGRIYNEDGEPLARISLLNVFINNKIIKLKTKINSLTNNTLNIFGSINHLDFILGKMNFKMTGEIPGILLNQLFKTHLSQITGFGIINLLIGGTYDLPQISGSVKINKMIIKTRGMAKPVAFKKIDLKIRNRFITVKTIRGDYNGGSFKIAGFITVQQNFFLNLKISGLNIPWSKRGVFRGEFNPTVSLVGYKNHMTLSGKVDIVTGRYIQKYDILKKYYYPQNWDNISNNSK